ncbi:hypothetical protein RyT2_14140 [Pseudolactococcus yaeyamensis]
MELSNVPNLTGQSAPNAYAQLKDVVYPDKTDANYLSTLLKLEKNGNLSITNGTVDGSIINIFRSIQWAIIKGLVSLSDLINTSVVSTLSFLNFADNATFKQFIEQFMPLVIILSLIFMVLAVLVAMSKKELPIIDVLKNGIFSWFVYLLLPILMTYGTAATQSFVAGYNQSNSSPAQIIVKNNLWDLRAMDKAGWNFTTVETMMKNGDGAPNFLTGTYLADGSVTLTTDDIGLIDVNTKLLNKEEKKLSDYGQKIVSHGVATPTNTEYVYTPTLYTLDDDLFAEDTHYYAFSWNFWTIFFSLLALVGVGIIVIWRLFQLETEIIMTWGVGSLMALSQWGTQKRNVEVIQKLFFGFVTLLFTANLLQIYAYGLTYLNTLQTTNDINGVVYIIGLLAFSLAIVDGPKIWQDLFGINAGLSSSVGKTLAMLQGARMLGALAQKGIGAAGRGLGGLGGLFKGSGGDNAAPEMKDPSPDTENRRDVTPDTPALETQPQGLEGNQPQGLGYTPETDANSDPETGGTGGNDGNGGGTTPPDGGDQPQPETPDDKQNSKQRFRLTPDGNIEPIPIDEDNTPEMKDGTDTMSDSPNHQPQMKPSVKEHASSHQGQAENFGETQPEDFGDDDWSYLMDDIPPEF